MSTPKPTKNIEKEYRLLIEQREKRRKLESLSYFILFISFTVLFIGLYNESHVYELEYIVPTVSGFVIMFIGNKIRNKAKLLELIPQQRLFFAFYSTADVLDNHINKKNFNSKKIAIFGIQKLSRFVLKWFTKATPITIKEGPESLFNYLNSSVSMIEQDNDEKIQLLKEALYGIAVKSFEKDPTLNDFSEFYDSLKNLFPIPVSSTLEIQYSIKTPNKIITFFKDNPKLKYITIGIVGFILYIIATSVTPPEYAVNVRDGFGVGLGIIALVVYLYDRNKNSISKNNSHSKMESVSPKKSYDIEIPPLAAKRIDSPYVVPNEHTISVQDTVVWQNNDDEEHSITSGRRQIVSKDNDVEDGKHDGLFDAVILPHHNFKFKFEKEGVYHYYCKSHKCSEATIIVK